MRERVCSNCGGRKYVVVGQNMVRCEFCGTLYVDEQGSKEEEVLLVGVNELIRQADFEGAIKQLDKIISLYPLSFEAFFSRALAKRKIGLYGSSRRGFKRPRFFQIPVSISKDEDYLKAIELAPKERKETFVALANRIEKIANCFSAIKAKGADVFVCGQADEQVVQALEAEKIKIYNLPSKDKEEEVFFMLNSAKVLLVFAEGGTSGFLHILDRWNFFVSTKRKPKGSLIVVAKDEKQKISFSKNVFFKKDATYLQDVVVQVKNGLENFVAETAKIDTVNVENVKPEKKEYASVETISPQDVGKYEVENKTASEAAKQKWAFLALKNGDFESAGKAIDEVLEKDPYCSEMLFAKLMFEKKIKTREDFFASISNFSNRERLDNILRYASRDFATAFVDDWEKLVEKLGAEEYYLTYLTYLASYKSPNREHFVATAASLAVETGDERLIAKVEACFDKTDVDKFVDFYYQLYQRHDDKKWLDKVLELDEGHSESNFTKLMENFATTEQKLSYRNRAEVEKVFQFVQPQMRTQAISSIVDLVLSVAFCNLEQAEAQLDFYLSYAQKESLSSLSRHVAETLQQQEFFSLAEKYAAIAAANDDQNDEIYWLLIQIKLHCKSENELILSKTNPTSLPEWESLLAVSNDQKDEYYAAIASKANTYTGKKQDMRPELLDKIKLKTKLNDFLIRNNQILIDAEKQNLTGTGYFKAQLQPFETLLADAENAQDFETYTFHYGKITERLEALDLSFDSSINVTHMQNRVEGLVSVQKQQDQQKAQEQKRQKSIAKDKLLKRYLIVLLEYFPAIFAVVLFGWLIVSPKSVLLVFPQGFLIFSMVFALAIAAGNAIWYLVKKRKLQKLSKVNHGSLFGIGIFAVLLFVIGFVWQPVCVQISSASEFQTLLHNASFANFSLTQDIDYQGKAWKSVNFYGSLEGNGYAVKNIKLTSGGIFSKNSGSVQNLTIEISESSVKGNFGILAKVNSGNVSNCVVSGSATVQNASYVGGLVGKNEGGSITGCTCDVSLVVTGEDVCAGALVGYASGGEIFQNKALGSLEVTATEDAEVGGLAGKVGSISLLERNGAVVSISVQATEEAEVGGLVGSGKTAAVDCYACGQISASAQTGYAGGLFGSFDNTNGTIKTSYAAVEIDSTLTAGSIVGYLYGRMDSCFSVGTLSNLCGLLSSAFSGVSSNCQNLTSGYYCSECNFSSEIWDLSVVSSQSPKLLWEAA